MARKRNGKKAAWAMGERLRDFVQTHPSGWDHNEWKSLLSALFEEGFDVSEPDTVGLELERVRVENVLEGVGVKGLGPKRRESLAAEFGTLWRLRHATVDEIAALPNVTRPLAEEVHKALN